MKKQVLKTGVSLLLAGTMLASTASANTTDELISELSQALETASTTESVEKVIEKVVEKEVVSEENLTLNSASSAKTETAVPVAPALDTWKMIHCQIISQGFEWTAPTSDYISRAQCNGLVALNPISLTPRSTVVNFVSQVLTPTSQATGKFDLSSLNAYGERIQKNLEFSKKEQALTANWTNLLKENEEFLQKTSLPDHLKDNLVFGLMYKEVGIPAADFKRIVSENSLSEIQKILDKYTSVADGDIAFLGTYQNLDQINVVKNNSTLMTAFSSVVLYPLTKDGKNLDVSQYSVELKNAPRWVVLSNQENAIRENITLTVLDSQINFSEAIPSEFQIVFTNKTTGKIFIKNVKLSVLEKFSENASEFTLSQFSLALQKYLTTN